jgi:hypothetical protein
MDNEGFCGTGQETLKGQLSGLLSQDNIHYRKVRGWAALLSQANNII